MLVTVVPGAKVPAPPLDLTIDIPTTKLVVVATVIVVPADDAPPEIYGVVTNVPNIPAPTNAVVGKLLIVKVLVPVIAVTVVPGAKAPVPDCTTKYMPTTKFVVLAVTVVPDDVAVAI